MAFRGVSTIIFSIFSMPFLWLALPLRPLNILLRKLGVAENGRLPLDLVQKLWASMVLWVWGITVTSEGSQNVPRDEGVVLMYSHASNLDPFVMMKMSPSAPKFIFKKSLLYTVPWIFPLARLYGHIPIDRSNRDAAIQSLTNAGKKMKQYHRAVCISPEGTRTLTGELQEFKKGPFHLAKGGTSSIVPAVIFNNFNLWPPGQLFPQSGELKVRFLKKIAVTDEDTVESLSEKVHAVMKAELAKVPPKFGRGAPWQGTRNAVIFWLASLLVAVFLYFRVFSN